MVLKLFECCTGARAPEGHVGMQGRFGTALCDGGLGLLGNCPRLCVKCIGVCMTARRCGSGSCGCWQDDRFCMSFMALLTLTTPTMRRCRENVPFFPWETVMVFCGNDRKGDLESIYKELISLTSMETEWLRYLVFNFQYCISFIGLEKLLKSVSWKLYLKEYGHNAFLLKPALVDAGALLGNQSTAVIYNMDKSGSACFLEAAGAVVYFLSHQGGIPRNNLAKCYRNAGSFASSSPPPTSPFSILFWSYLFQMHYFLSPGCVLTKKRIWLESLCTTALEVSGCQHAKQKSNTVG